MELISNKFRDFCRLELSVVSALLYNFIQIPFLPSPKLIKYSSSCTLLLKLCKTTVSIKPLIISVMIVIRPETVISYCPRRSEHSRVGVKNAHYLQVKFFSVLHLTNYANVRRNCSYSMKVNNKTRMSQVGAISKAQIKSKLNHFEPKISEKSRTVPKKKRKGDPLHSSGFVGYV